MAKKTTKVIENSNSLFDDNDIKVAEKPKKTRKITKKRDDNSTDNHSSSKSSSKLLGNDKKPQNVEKTRRTKSKEVGDSSSGKQLDVKEPVHKDTGKRRKRKSDPEPVVVAEKPKRKSRKSKNDTVEVQTPTVVVEEKKKSGPKRWKYGFYKGCEDRLVWIEEIGHWVSKSAFTQTDPKHPVYTKENYVQGLDSWWILNCYKPIVKDDSHIWINLEKANKILKKKYKTWKELSAHPGLTEEFLTEYKDYIDWTTFMFNNVDRTFSNGFRKKFHDKFLILVTRW